MGFKVILGKILHLKVILGFLLTGILFTVVGVVIIASPKSELMPAKATIKEIQESFDGEDTQYTLIIDYTDNNGVEHKNLEYMGYTTGMKVNDVIDIQYDVNSPECISTPGGEFVPYIFLAVGIICIIVSVIALIKAIVTP